MAAEPRLVEVSYPTISYVENKPVKMKLDVGNYLRSIQLYAVGQVDSDATWTAIDEDNPLKIIQNVELYGILKSGRRGKVTFVDCGADLLYYYDYFMSGTAGYRVDEPDAISETDQVPEVRLELNFLPRFVIDTNKFTELWLKILWGDGDDLAVAAGCCTVDSFEIYVQTEEYVKKPAGLMGWIRELSEKSKNIAAAGTSELELPKSMLYRQLMVEAIDSSIRDSDILTNLEVKYGRTKSVFQSDFKSMQVKNKSQYRVETLEAGFPTIDGIVMLPFRQLINPVKFATWDLEYVAGTPTATSTIRTLIDRVAPLGKG